MESNGCSPFMRSRSNLEVRRCRPLLGTFVEITASLQARTAAALGQQGPAAARDCAPPTLALQNAVNAAFSAIERIQSLMSVHDPASELSLVNCKAAEHPVTVSRELFTV